MSLKMYLKYDLLNLKVSLQTLNYVYTIYYVLMTLSLARPLYNGDVSLEFGYVNRLAANVMRREHAAL